jgi:rhodanese-related sulfurtransferase
VELARQCGLEIGSTGGIKVDDQLRTSDPNIFAGGDCVETVHQITDRKFFISMGSLANRHGRVIAEVLAGNEDRFPGSIGTCFLKFFDYNIGATGLTEKAAEEQGLKPRCVWGTFPDRAEYHPEKQMHVVKLVYDAGSTRLLGLQAVGMGDITRRVDVLAAMLQHQATVEDLFRFEQGYAPPFSEALDPLHHLAGMARAQQKGTVFRHPLCDMKADADRLLIVDVRETEEHAGKPLPPVLAECGAEVINIPLGEIRGRTDEVKRGKTVVVVCQRGSRSYQAARFLNAAGLESVEILGGGLQSLL